MNNIDKIMYYIQTVQKKPTEIDGRIYDGHVNRIQLGKTFFMKDSCNSCGSCCVPESNVYTESEYRRILGYAPTEVDRWNIPIWEREREISKEVFQKDEAPLLTSEEYKQFIQDLEKVTICVNGQPKNIYVYNLRKQVLQLAVKDKPIDRCTWVHEIDPGVFVCKIHPIVSITCTMPHLTMRVSTRGTLRISTHQFGRNWAMHCSVCFKEPENKHDFEMEKQRKMHKLLWLLNCAEDLGIDTYLPEIVDYIERIPYEGHENYLMRDIVNLHTSNLQKLIEGDENE